MDKNYRRWKVYLARTDATSDSFFKDCRAALQAILLKTFVTDVDITYHEKGCVYKPNLLGESSALFIAVETSHIGKGVQGQIDRAYSLGIPVFIIYRRQYDSTIQFYNYGTYLSNPNTSDWRHTATLVFGENVTDKMWSDELSPQINFDTTVEMMEEYQDQMELENEFHELKLEAIASGFELDIDSINSLLIAE